MLKKKLMKCRLKYLLDFRMLLLHDVTNVPAGAKAVQVFDDANQWLRLLQPHGGRVVRERDIGHLCVRVRLEGAMECERNDLWLRDT